MSQNISYPKLCAMCGKDYDVEAEAITENQWEQIQRDIWANGTCPQCNCTATVVEE